MIDNQVIIQELIEQNISFELVKCDVSEYVPSYSQWRNFPFNGIVCPEVGECHYELPSGEKWSVKPGESLIIPVNVNHKFEMHKGMVSSTHLHFTIFENIDLLSLFSVPLILKGEASEKIYLLLKELDQTLEEKNKGGINIRNIVKINSVILQLLTTILEASQIKSESLSFIVHFQKILPVIRYIREHLDEEISREDMANVISLSPTRFHYVFTKIMKISPVAYLKKLRFEKSQQLLISTDLSISQIAEKVGFRDIFHFSKQFKKNVGMSPSKYRENLKISLFRVD